MGFKQRERKRRKKAAQQSAAAKIRRKPKDSTDWWLTIVRRSTCCARCAGVLRPGREMVFRKTPCEALCVPCAEARGVKFRPSMRWEANRAREVERARKREIIRDSEDRAA